MSDGSLLTVGRYRPTQASSRPLSLTPIVVWVVLLVLAAIAWAVTIFQARSMRQMADMPGMPVTSSPAVLFLSVWAAMMVAMMFPSAALSTGQSIQSFGLESGLRVKRAPGFAACFVGRLS